MLVMVTWFSTLLAFAVNASVRRLSPKRKDRFKLEFTVIRNSPGMVLRPALPNCPGGGVVNAGVLKYGWPSAWIGRPVASARRLPPPPARPPVFERVPATYAVSGVPVVALKLPLRFQLFRSCVFQPPLRSNPRTPTGDESWNPALRLCRTSKLDSPRSSSRLPRNCTTVPPVPLKLDVSSIPLANVYSAFADTEHASRRVTRTCPAS